MISDVESGEAGKNGVLDHPYTPKSSHRDSHPQYNCSSCKRDLAVTSWTLQKLVCDDCYESGVNTFQWRIHLDIYKNGDKIVDEGMIQNYIGGEEQTQINFLNEFITTHLRGECQCIKNGVKI